MKVNDNHLIFAAVILLFFAAYSPQKTEMLIIENQEPSAWFYAQRAFPTGHLNQKTYRQAQRQSIEMRKQSRLSQDQWIPAGPTNIGGRIVDIELKPGSPETIYLGTASGGVFKSIDDAQTFSPIFDQSLSLSIGDIAIAPSNPEVLYVGTGEANPGGGSLAYDGYGVYKSVDDGGNWQDMGLHSIGSVGRVAVSPQDANTAYVAAMGYLFENNSERGVFKTTDGGENWDQVLYLNDSTGAVDLSIHPLHPDTLYAVMWERVRRLEYYVYGGSSCGIYRSYNGGQNWEELSNGLPTGSNIGRIGIDISQSNPDVLYAIYADKTGYFEGLYKSEDGGDSWFETNDNSLSNIYSSYGWWFGRLKIDPQDEEVVYAIGFDVYKTSNGGDSWSYKTGIAHVDMHEVAISAVNSSRVFLANDGGLYSSNNGGDSWTHENGLPITQFYTCEIDESVPERLYGGAQDNGTNRTLSGNPDAWASIYGGDGFRCLVDPNDDRYIYVEYQYGNLARSTNYGSSFTSATSGISSSDRKNWNTPVTFNPLNPNSLYYGANRLYKSINKAVSWSAISDDLSNGAGSGNQKYGTITTISVSPVDTNYIYAGTDDANVWLSKDNGEFWQNISNGLPQRWISRLVADPFDVHSAYVCLSGYRENDYMPHLLKTEDEGATWQDISAGLPEAPINDLIVDPQESSRLIVATDVGVFYRDGNTESWQALGEGLPLIPITDLDFQEASNKLVAATYGRSMYYLELTVGTQKQKTIRNSQLHLAPNPTSDYFNIVMPYIRGHELLEIYSINGKLLFSQSLSNAQLTFNVHDLHLSKGVYIVNLEQDGKTYAQQLIVE
jgi:photosystem II stability/assembly factor-like uncharacterized protein